MKKFLLLILSSYVVCCSFAQNKVLPDSVQIRLALLSAPAEKKDSATVYGYSANGKDLVLLRKGGNEVICLADDPNQPGFSVACYQKDLEPFMKRGRELRKMGKDFQQVFDTREQEAKSGKLVMPKHPSTLFVYSASKEDYDSATGELKKGYLRSVIYIPYATPQTTGLPLKPEAPGMPWMMDPGTHAAHIMINPPQK